MSLAELTSARAVEQAIAEFDRLKREPFLTKYGFGQAREYFVRHENRLYDSKAIVGAAFGYQYPDRGPLKPSDFSGGEATVQTKLEELGFEMVVVKPVTPPPSQITALAVADLEKRFHVRMINIYKAAKDIGYNASRFLTMVNEHGGVETARILLRSANVSDGYTALWERGRLDLTVEAVLLEPEWAQLFSPNDHKVAVARLRQYGYTGSLPAE